MKEKDLKSRTKNLALNVLRFVRTLPGEYWVRNIANQLARSGTSVGANYRAVCRAKSKLDFVSKLATVEEELDETLYWLEILEQLEVGSFRSIQELYREADELTAVVVSSIKTTRAGMLKDFRKLAPIE